MPDTGASSMSPSAELREEQRRQQIAFWEYYVKNHSTIEQTDPHLYTVVRHVTMQQIGRALGHPNLFVLTPSEQDLFDDDLPLLSEEWPIQPSNHTAEDAVSLVSTMPWGPFGESEIQTEQFYSAHSRIAPEEEAEDQLQQEPGDGPADPAARDGGGAPFPGPQVEMIPRLRVLFEQLTIDGQPVEEGRQPSFSGDAEAEQFRLLGATHNHTDTECTLKTGSIQIAIMFIPWVDQALLVNKSARPLCVTKKNSDGSNAPDMLLPRKSTILDPGYWALQGNGDYLRLQLRPCRYSLLLEVETKKRRAGPAGPAPPLKAARVSAAERGPGEGSVLDLDPEQTGKGLVRRALPDDIGSLASYGVPLDHTLFMVDRATGHNEYSIKRLDSWILRREYGVIFRAAWRQGEQAQLVIIKMHKPQGPDTVQQAIWRWRREVKVHRILRHERIASLVAFDARLLMLAVELKDACDLGSRSWCYARKTRRAGLFKGNVNDAYTICTDMSNALSYLAEKNIFHGDIKALNILYSRKNGAALIDFGLSYFDDKETFQTGGSPWYKEPYKKKMKGISSDIFSLGVVMLYVIGEIPLRLCSYQQL